MKRAEVYQEVKTFLVVQMDVPEADVSEGSHLVDDLEIDSLSVLELTVFTEENYDVNIEEAFKESLSADNSEEPTVGWLTDLIVTMTPRAAV
jgi:acyl carrier protein